jgi:predicted peptidase
MNVRVLATLILTVLVSMTAADEQAVKNQKKKTFKGRSVKQMKLQYLLFLPQGYKEDKKKQWPLMLFLHGAGERGSDIAKVTVHGPPKIVKERADFPFILVSPQCPAGESWSDEALLGLLDEVIKKHRVDKTRVYLTGLSMGGYGTWSLGLRHPERFAAIAPICGGGDFLPILLPPPGIEPVLKRLPVWVFHGGKDNLVPPAESQRMVDALKRLGNDAVKQTIYPEAGHDSWTETYNNQELYDWMLQHKIAGKKAARKTRKIATRAG